MSGMFEFPATLMRELSVRAVDISASGCLLVSRRRIEVGTIGTLQLKLGSEECKDDVEVVRCEAVKGTATIYHVGVRLLWTRPRQAGSIRDAVARHVTESNQPDTARVM
jgi:PilZ domain